MTRRKFGKLNVEYAVKEESSSNFEPDHTPLSHCFASSSASSQRTKMMAQVVNNEVMKVLGGHGKKKIQENAAKKDKKLRSYSQVESKKQYIVHTSELDKGNTMFGTGLADPFVESETAKYEKNGYKNYITQYLQ